MKGHLQREMDEEKYTAASSCRCSVIIHLQRKALQKTELSQASIRLLDEFPLELSPAQSSLSSTLNVSHIYTYRTI